jgi:hypothetical protein
VCLYDMTVIGGTGLVGFVMGLFYMIVYEEEERRSFRFMSLCKVR